MPNTGKPSLDCHLCRSRRVKCDLARPSCQRCFRYGVDCPGYRDQQDLMFRNADPSRSRKRKGRAQQERERDREQELQTQLQVQPASVFLPAVSAAVINGTPSWDSSILGAPYVFPGSDAGRALPGTAPQVGSSPSTSDSAWQLQVLARSTAEQYEKTTQQPQLYMTVAEHWTTYSVPMMLSIYAPISFLSDMYSNPAPDGPLVWAAHLFARTYVTNMQYPTAVCHESYHETQRELGMYLGKTLSAVSAALKEPTGAMRDDILATVWTLVNYETLMGSLDRPHLMSSWHTHTLGLYSILKARGEDSLKTESSRAAFWTSYTLVQIDCLIRNTPCPKEASRWLDVIKASMTSGEQFAVIASDFVRKVAGLQASMLSIVRRSDYVAASNEYDTLVSGVLGAEDEAEVDLARVTDTATPLDFVWLQVYYSALIKCYHITQIYINFLSHYEPSVVSRRELERRRDYSIRRVRSAAQGILDHIPLALQPLIAHNDKSPRMLFSAMMVIWPLTAIYITPLALPEQIGTAENALLFIGRELGIKQALSSYPGTSATQIPVQAHAPNGFGDCEMTAWVGRLR